MVCKVCWAVYLGAVTGVAADAGVLGFNAALLDWLVCWDWLEMLEAA